eukprot:364073-Chlamydomonas_euryale.AAC.6
MSEDQAGTAAIECLWAQALCPTLNEWRAPRPSAAALAAARCRLLRRGVLRAEGAQAVAPRSVGVLAAAWQEGRGRGEGPTPTSRLSHKPACVMYDECGAATAPSARPFPPFYPPRRQCACTHA